MLFDAIKKQFDGDIKTDLSTKISYSTDASVYKEMPLGVAFPKNQKDLVRLISFAKENHPKFSIRIIKKKCQTQNKQIFPKVF